MLLKNTVARLITINGPLVQGTRSKAFKILPGNNPAVEVPDELCDNAFVKALIEDGSIVKVAGEESDPLLDMSKSDLIALAESHDIEITSRETKDTLVEKIKAVS